MVKKIIKKSLLLIAFSFFCQIATAEPRLSTSIQPQEGSLDDVFRFAVTINGTNLSNPPLLSGGEDFSLRLVGPHSSMVISNGDVSSQVTYNYELRAKHEGVLDTPAAEIELGGKKLTADPIKVKVSKAQDKPAGRPGDPVFVKQSVNKDKVYVGEQLPLTFTLYTQYQLRNLKIEDQTLDGFWSESFGEGKQSNKELNGIGYAAVEERKALFAVKSGTLTIPACTAEAEALMPRKNRNTDTLDPFSDEFFQDFFRGAELQHLTLKSNSISLEALPLPPAPQELGISSSQLVLVGNTSLSVKYTPDVVKVGSSKTIEVEVVSEGNLNQISNLPFENSNEVKVYAEQPEVKLDTRGSKIVFHKTFRYSLVPLKKGLVRVPGIKLPYFDPITESYKLAETSDIAFPVEGGSMEAEAPTVNTNPKIESNSEQPTPEPIQKQSGQRYEESTPSTLQLLSEKISTSLGLLIMLAAVGLVAIAYWLYRASKEPKRAATNFARVQSVQELNKAVRSEIKNVLKIRGDASSKEQLSAELLKIGLNQESQLAVQNLLDDLELFAYGPEKLGAEELPKLKERAARIISGL